MNDDLPPRGVSMPRPMPRMQGWGVPLSPQPETPHFVEQAVTACIEAQSIVRMLALVEPLNFAGWCVVCDSEADSDDGNVVERHEPTCPWRRAVEWVRANPA